MPRSSKEHKFILCVIDEVTNYLITVGDMLIENVITKYCAPEIKQWIKIVCLCPCS